jgi:uncharacterized protein (TIGR00251 family)
MNLDRFTGLEIHERSGAVRIAVKVQARSSRDEIVGVLAGALKVKLTAPPVDGAANEALIELLSSELGVPKRRISIVGGETSKSKLIEIATG